MKVTLTLTIMMNRGQNVQVWNLPDGQRISDDGSLYVLSAWKESRY